MHHVPSHPTLKSPETSRATQEISPPNTVDSLKPVIILISSDATTYQTVDITGMKDADFIKERIFTKLCISDDEDRTQFAIYLTQIMQYAIGSALTDDDLYAICRDRGDGVGTLKFFIAHSSASVHERLAQPVNTIPPPVLPSPANVSYSSRASRPRSPSHSVSSVSESQNNDLGYVADVDNPDRVDRRHVRPLPRVTPNGPPSTKDNHPPSDYSPSSYTSPSNLPPKSASSQFRSQVASGAPLSSPNRTQFHPEDPLALAHLRSGSDTDNPRVPLKTQMKQDRHDRLSRRGDGDWVTVNHPINESRPQDGRKSPSSAVNRRSPGNKRQLVIPTAPRNAPPPPPDGRTHSNGRPNAVPAAWLITAKPPVNKTDKLVATPPPWTRNYTKDMSKTKSMNDLKAAGMMHPTRLTPGGGHRPGLPHAPRDYNVPSKAHGSRGQFPPTGSVHPSHLDYQSHITSRHNSSHLSPSTSEVYPRPRSALGSPIHGPQSGTRLQSPQYDIPHETETARSPLPFSPLAAGMGTIIASKGESSYGTGTMRPPADPQESDREEEFWKLPGYRVGTAIAANSNGTMVSFRSYGSTSTYTDDGDDWKVRPDRPPSILTHTKPSLKVNTADPRQQKRTTFVDAPGQHDRTRRIRDKQDDRESSKFTERVEETWAPRPPAEDVYEDLDTYFPGHDLDRPVVDANSGGTSPTALDVGTAPPRPVSVVSNAESSRMRYKKSIRIVAEEHKKKYRESRADPAQISSNMLRKRSTKLWGSKPEEIMAGKDKSVPPLPFLPPESPPDSAKDPKASFKWVRGELIGQGTYGKVYLALNASTGEMMAVKQVDIPRSASAKSDSRQIAVVDALKFESETLKDLEHPHVVQYLGFEETPHNLSIFLEYVPGGSIGSCLVKHGKFDEEVTKSFAGQILSGLEYLHSRGVLHRDMKADNILVETSGICKISDFGISKRTDDVVGGASTAMKGTVFWMAPEVINPKKYNGYNFKIDIWSVGCVVLEMWAGSRPWMGIESVAVMFQLYQASQPPPVPEDVLLSSSAEDFRLKCFAINPEDRPSAAELRKHPYLALQPGWIFTGFK